MSNGFLGLNIALSGLFANQRQLGIVSHNVSNAGTKGYSRQMMDTQAYNPYHLPGGMGSIGRGVDITPIRQVRDEYLDYKLRFENSVKSEWESRTEVLKQLEDIFNEPSEFGLSTRLDKFYEALRTWQENPENLTARATLRQNIIAFSEAMRRSSNMLKDIQKDLNFQFRSAVDTVNGYAQKIRDMNEAIHKAEIEGGRSNDLRDRRNVLVDELSNYVNVEYYEDEKKRFHVLVGGQHLVSHYRADQFKMSPRETRLNDDDSYGIYDATWSNGNEIFLRSGKLKGLKDVRDNPIGDLKGIPYYIDKLNEFASTFISEMNEVHAKGYGLDGSSGHFVFTTNGMSSAQFREHLLKKGLNGASAVETTETVLKGTENLSEKEKLAKIRENKNQILANNPLYANKTIFQSDEKFYIVDKIKASELSLASDLEDLNKLAAATKKENLAGDSTNALKMIQTRHHLDMFDWGAPDDFVKSLVSNLGVDAQDAYRVTKNQELLVKEYNINRESVMSVSLDEEIASMMKYQTAYSANARMVNVFDEMLDLLVNRLGLVGR
ncbi:MAG: flagellar hook-associated protein FlgK [Bacillota bacterium]|nr:flagellar hook-associated protein FlgK [Bacillota bacterium]